MRWLVTGAGGQLGSRLAVTLTGEDAVCLTRAELDVTSFEAVHEAIRMHRPDVVINTAAYTAVDAAETDEAAALAVNRDGPANLARALASVGGGLIHISTDYVFAGNADRPYEVDDPTAPVNAYGRSKLAGELALRGLMPDRSTIVRSAWLFGGPGTNFVDTMVRLERERPTVDVVADQIGSPTYVADLAAALVELGTSPRSMGVLHFANSSRASWFDLAREAFRLLGADPERVRPTTTDRLARPATRPAWSVLSTRSWSNAGFIAPRHWRAALSDSLRRLAAKEVVADLRDWKT